MNDFDSIDSQSELSDMIRMSYEELEFGGYPLGNVDSPSSDELN